MFVREVLGRRAQHVREPQGHELPAVGAARGCRGIIVLPEEAPNGKLGLAQAPREDVKIPRAR